MIVVHVSENLRGYKPFTKAMNLLVAECSVSRKRNIVKYFEDIRSINVGMSNIN